MISEAEMAARLLVAAVLCGAVGLERERSDRGAGLRTHALVGLGACLVMLVSAFGFADWHDDPGALDPSRMAAQVVSGVGFLGAGVIIFQRDREVVRGLTTAASVWVVAAIGLAVGGGLYVTSIVSTAITLLILAGVKPLERRLRQRRSPPPLQATRVGLEVDPEVLPVRAVMRVAEQHGLQVQRVRLRPAPHSDRQQLDLLCSGDAAADVLARLLEQLRELPGVTSVTNVQTSTRGASQDSASALQS
jgi:putative Mg2+ transporter-C (MgtC) family protein